MSRKGNRRTPKSAWAREGRKWVMVCTAVDQESITVTTMRERERRRRGLTRTTLTELSELT